MQDKLGTYMLMLRYLVMQKKNGLTTDVWID
jgi:hypothetical protein